MVSLKALIVSLAVLAVVFSSAISASAAGAGPNDKVVQISRISAYPSGSDVVVSVSLKADKRLTDAKVVVSVPEFSVRSSRRIDFSRSRKQAIQIEVPIPAGLDPHMRIAFNSGDGRRVKYRPIILQ